MRQYLDIAENIMNYGFDKKPVRVDKDGNAIPVENGTIGLPNVVFSHNMQKGFPLLTTKKMAWKTIKVELEGFIKGITSKKWFQERGCHIWDQWCNPSSIKESLSREEKHNIMAETNDLGAIYGFQWRRFNQAYDENDGGWVEGYENQADQLKTIADRLKSNPYDRRMVCSAWNPLQINIMALPPCHLAWGVVVYGEYLSLWWTQRSCDLMLGVPFNIASYGLLLSLLAKHAGLKPYNLTGILCDCHIYENQFDMAREQIGREPRALPNIVLPDNLDIFEWTHDQVELQNYNPHGKLTSKVTIT